MTKYNDWMLEGHFERVDNMLFILDAEQLAPGVILAVLSAVNPARERLKNRDAFALKATEVLSQKLEPARATRLMKAWK